LGGGGRIGRVHTAAALADAWIAYAQRIINAVG
jgi:hypothetical protein